MSQELDADAGGRVPDAIREGCFGGDAVDEFAKLLAAVADLFDVGEVAREIAHAVMAQAAGEAGGEHGLLSVAEPDAGLAVDQRAKDVEFARVHRNEFGRYSGSVERGYRQDRSPSGEPQLEQKYSWGLCLRLAM